MRLQTNLAAPGFIGRSQTWLEHNRYRYLTKWRFVYIEGSVLVMGCRSPGWKGRGPNICLIKGSFSKTVDAYRFLARRRLKLLSQKLIS
jgi:hypothetical protein